MVTVTLTDDGRTAIQDYTLFRHYALRNLCKAGGTLEFNALILTIRQEPLYQYTKLEVMIESLMGLHKDGLINIVMTED